MVYFYGTLVMPKAADCSSTSEPVIVEKMTPGAVHGPDYLRGRVSNRGREGCDEVEAAVGFLVAFAFDSLPTIITILLVAEFKLVVHGEELIVFEVEIDDNVCISYGVDSTGSWTALYYCCGGKCVE